MGGGGGDVGGFRLVMSEAAVQRFSCLLLMKGE